MRASRYLESRYLESRYNLTRMIELMLLGFLAADGPLHGYELRKRMTRLHGWTRVISDGTIYPAIDRLLKSGAISATAERGTAAAPRRLLTLTPAGRERLHELLRSAGGTDISDFGRYSAVLAFLSLLPDAADRDAVLRRRLAFLEEPVGFFFDGDVPVRAAEVTDPYRLGVLTVARASRTAELAWLRERLGSP
jgi:DNA-binding PadR family transcriptional regulator